MEEWTVYSSVTVGARTVDVQLAGERLDADSVPGRAAVSAAVHDSDAADVDVADDVTVRRHAGHDDVA